MALGSTSASECDLGGIAPERDTVALYEYRIGPHDLIPVPESIWRAIPGREIYATVLESLATESGLGWRALSLIPDKTEGAFHAALPAVAVFAGVYLLPVKQTRQLIYLLIGIAGVQAALGLMQFGAGSGSPLYFGNPFSTHASAVGSYANRDHFAGFLEMVFPITLALLAAKVGRKEKKPQTFQLAASNRVLCRLCKGIRS